MQPFSLLIKPASADCNLRCDYCFYLDKSALYPESGKHRMSEATLRVLLQRYFETPQPAYAMVWQGGEPSLMGAPFYKQVTELQKELAPRGARIANSMQTNATMVGDGLAAHMSKYRFLTGVSIDGPAELHDVSRRTVKGKSTHARVVQGLRTLQKHRVPVSGVTLVSTANVEEPVRVYRHLRELGLSSMQFVPCVEWDAAGEPLPWTITGEQWGRFLEGVFEEWFVAQDWNVSVRNFESVLARLVGAQSGECRLCERCDQYLVVEYNGDIYPCDFFVNELYRLGNIHDISLLDAREAQAYAAFAQAKSHIPALCGACPYLSVCMGDCPKFRLAAPAGATHAGRSWLCEGWLYFFRASWDRFHALARNIASRAA
ncbi:anaerobic sulfatase maturase [Oceanidesulfovibrio indonesiensis]|uniref:Anaerobic sulfatase maturase n=1 Tax=Oceanidesulfovibrio indonesiensis TaxID=54767 RepID=A0A7M3MI74_9BACT|nr:anaerobic sulfatase maturase [Oceanidesulfovibrio indonesiensis]TVM19394.1 anaerobic sulfatase maturase [Oceanidesulfovibrio indonesiensis]